MLITILALETSADETSTAIGQGDTVKKTFRLLSHVIYSQIQTHRKTGGIVPEVAARVHIPKIIPAIKLALKNAKLKLQNIDAIAVTSGPGLITSLMVGVDTAKALAFALGKPIIPINHLEGHLLSALAHNSSSPPLILRGSTPSLRVREGGNKLRKILFPALGLIVSGGHTLLVLIKNIGQYKTLGQTLDDAAGECFDKVAKILGLPYPGGPELAKLAKSGNPKAVDFPRPMLNSKNYNFSFAGLKTAVLYLWRDSIKYHVSSMKQFKKDIAASVEQAIVDVLVAKTLRAVKEFKIKTVLLGGGVSANNKLKKTLGNKIKSETRNTKYLIPDTTLTTDNAGMIALAGFYYYFYGHTTTFDTIKADPNLELKSWR